MRSAPPQDRRSRPGVSPRPAGRRVTDALTSGAFLLPAVALVGALLLVPFATTLAQSFTDDNGYTSSFVGFANYTALLRDPNFTRALINTLLWTIGTLVLPVGLGLAIAVMTNGLPAGRWIRIAFVLPYALSGTATAVIWGFILRSDGALNQAVGFFGFEPSRAGFLLEWPTNTIVMVLANTWQAVGVAVILFLVGLKSVPTETVEAATLDGAGGFRVFRSVVLPQLKAVTVVVVGMSLANSLRVFDLIWLLTKGGPGGASETLAVTMYRESFILNDYGYGAAVAVVLAVIVVACSAVYLRRQLPKEA